VIPSGTRRLSALAEICDGGSRSDAARIGGVGLQSCAIGFRFNAKGSDGLLNGKAQGASRGRGVTGLSASVSSTIFSPENRIPVFRDPNQMVLADLDRVTAALIILHFGRIASRSPGEGFTDPLSGTLKFVSASS
jgi:hypothetical protein